MANKYGKKESSTTGTGERRIKDNSRKHAHVREQWEAKKREGRPKQTWVTSEVQENSFGVTEVAVPGRWEKAIEPDWKKAIESVANASVKPVDNGIIWP
jgi:hypothetical protein